MKRLIAVVLMWTLLLAVAGCQSVTPIERYYVAEKSLQAVTVNLQKLYRAGMLKQDDAEESAVLLGYAVRALDVWWTEIQANPGNEPLEVIRRFDVILEQLLRIEGAVRGTGNGEPTGNPDGFECPCEPDHTNGSYRKAS